METAQKPKMEVLDKGEEFKTLQITAQAGMIMPAHHSTREVVVIIQQGRALLKLPDGNQEVRPGSAVIIPPGTDHSLEIREKFVAHAVMKLDSEIEFQNN